MKLLRLLLLSALLTSAAWANDLFPGLKSVLSEAEWKRAGLDQLTPDQIGVIDAALIRHMFRVVTVPPAAPTSGNAPAAAGETNRAQSAAAKARFWESFGLAKSNADWRTQPPMMAKVTGTRGANGFTLDNGQVWEAIEQMPFEVLGQSVTVEARPMGAFALKLNGDSIPVRVHRLR
jgi:hypothetical protein